MRSLQVVGHFTDAQLKGKLSESHGSLSHTRWQLIYLIQIGNIHSAELLLPVINLSVHSIYKIVENYNRIGAAALMYKPKGGRRRSLLNVDEEAILFASLEQKAAKGLVKTANDIRGIVEKKVGRSVSDDYLWDLLNRNGWKKKMPRPHHPKRSVEEQEAFKKNSPKNWRPQP
jgi:transposase